MTLQLASDEANALLTGSDDPQFIEEFFADRNVSDVQLDAHFVVGRTWEPEETDDGGMTVRTKPHPNVRVFERRDDGGHIVVLCVRGPGIVISAFELHGGLHGFLEKLVRSIDEDYDGIEEVQFDHMTEDYETHANTINGAVSEVLPV